jgi:hypothetical protein
LKGRVVGGQKGGNFGENPRPGDRPDAPSPSTHPAKPREPRKPWLRSAPRLGFARRLPHHRRIRQSRASPENRVASLGAASWVRSARRALALFGSGPWPRSRSRETPQSRQSACPLCSARRIGFALRRGLASPGGPLTIDASGKAARAPRTVASLGAEAWLRPSRTPVRPARRPVEVVPGGPFLHPDCQGTSREDPSSSIIVFPTEIVPSPLRNRRGSRRGSGCRLADRGTCG